MKPGINVNVSQIIKSFMNDERCIMHKNVSDVPINEINLSEKELDKLLFVGARILKIREIWDKRRVG